MYYSDGNEKVYVKADLEGNNCKNIFSQKSNEIQSITGDGTYYYFDNSFQVANGSSKEQKITVCDENLKEIDTFKLPNMDTKTYNFLPLRTKIVSYLNVLTRKMNVALLWRIKVRLEQLAEIL